MNIRTDMLPRLVRNEEPRADGVIAIGTEVIRMEAAALSALAGAIDGTFARAVDMLMDTRGRVIVAGLGKSGHVARKMAATFASTGTPAFFLHLAEAGHGDLGMIAPGDLLVVISYSGRTAELRMLGDHARRIGVPIIAITAAHDGPLLELAAVRLVLPILPEACPMALSPTTSTTMTMALGDALAVAAMRLRGIQSAELKSLHPGGNIGMRLRTVQSVMHGQNSLPLVAETQPMAEVILVMTERSFGTAGVVDSDGLLTGVITDGDLRRHAEALFHLTAEQAMTCAPITIAPEANLETALALMKQEKITALFVVDSFGTMPARPVGILHIHDLLRLGMV